MKGLYTRIRTATTPTLWVPRTPFGSPVRHRPGPESCLLVFRVKRIVW